ncbi:MAG: ribonuclease H-like domain-containing protein [Hadesarchaea archaeon]|nr:ribonuclease H-like domain-containing protein [Hadesarchaea archaeon]
MTKIYSLDIETTGLDPEEYQITAIGIGKNDDVSSVEVKFVESPEKEGESIKWLSEYLEDPSEAVIFTWRPFDFHFIKTRASDCGVENPLEEAENFDLHEWIKENEYDGEEIHLEEVMKDFDLEGKYLPGMFMPVFYKLYTESEKEEDKRKIVKHCKRDVEGMIEIINQLSDDLLK